MDLLKTEACGSFYGYAGRLHISIACAAPIADSIPIAPAVNYSPCVRPIPFGRSIVGFRQYHIDDLSPGIPVPHESYQRAKWLLNG